MPYVHVLVSIHSLIMSSVGIAKGYGLDGRGLIPGGARFFLFSIASILALWSKQLPTVNRGLFYLR
jgi:hypothetical protein